MRAGVLTSILPVVWVVAACASQLQSAHSADSAPAALPQVAPQTVQEDWYPRKNVTFSNGATGIPALTYATPKGFRPLTLDLYVPPKEVQRPEQGFPLVAFIHGGAWLAGHPHRSGAFVDFPEVLALLSARGYVVASIEYRLSGEAPFPAQIQDVKAAIRWLRFRAPEFAIDPARAMTWGVSAGGHLAGLAAVSCDAPALEPVQEEGTAVPDEQPDVKAPTSVSHCVQGGVAWYGVFNIATIAAQARQEQALSRDAPDAPEWLLTGCFATQCKEGQLEAASPVSYVDPKDPPLLLLVGNADKTVPYLQTVEMAEKLKAAGVPHEVTVLPGLDHGFIGKSPEETREANLHALAATFEFFDKVLGVKASGVAKK
ncbi:alpha/beta hydrolase [Pyxidicoccus trucidator]|uniref:alpha/beta hydrolase n=1 Tax=Pyxidicoccus trucidator TaxID=2709662 RepID=UPI0013DB604E|nr:alpha/beta hydrolase [Pyxidicoccus trucidator]